MRFHTSSIERVRHVAAYLIENVEPLGRRHRSFEQAFWALGDPTNGTSLGANHYKALTCEQRLFPLLGLDSRGLQLKPSVFHLIN